MTQGRLSWLGALASLTALLGLSAPANALPVFAHRYGFSCEACHTIVPQLNRFGQLFLAAGYRLPSQVERRGTFPVAVKFNVQYSSANGPQLPPLILDELEFLSAASVSHNLSYRLEQYAVDGGLPGRTRDAWLMYANPAAFARNGLSLRLTAGQFTLPLPIDPETQRPTQNHYAIFDQRVGANPFDFFDDRIGLDVAYGDRRSIDVHALALKGHDPASGLPTKDLDGMLVAQRDTGAITWTGYGYWGQRPLGLFSDHFVRDGIGAMMLTDRAELDVLGQTGFDSSVDGFGHSARSSGGFLQTWWWFTPRFVNVMRFDFASDGLSGQSHSLTASLIYRPYRNARLTLEDVIGVGHALNAAWLFAY